LTFTGRIRAMGFRSKSKQTLPFIFDGICWV